MKQEKRSLKNVVYDREERKRKDQFDFFLKTEISRKRKRKEEIEKNIATSSDKPVFFLLRYERFFDNGEIQFSVVGS